MTGVEVALLFVGASVVLAVVGGLASLARWWRR